MGWRRDEVWLESELLWFRERVLEAVTGPALTAPASSPVASPSTASVEVPATASARSTCWQSGESRSIRSISASRMLGGSGPSPSMPAARSSSVKSGLPSLRP